MSNAIEALRREIAHHPSNEAFLARGLHPLFVAHERAQLIIIGHAPSLRAQQSMVPWNDASGLRLMHWLGIPESVFRDPAQVAHLPMDFYYQGKDGQGDRHPRGAFAPLWHARLLDLMPDARLLLLLGRYAQAYYLGKAAGRTLTDTVRAFHEYLPRFFPLVHPSPLNQRWLSKNAWFEEELLPELQQKVREILFPEAALDSQPAVFRSP